MSKRNGSRIENADLDHIEIRMSPAHAARLEREIGQLPAHAVGPTIGRLFRELARRPVVVMDTSGEAVGA